jgi:hypothetical protein
MMEEQLSIESDPKERDFETKTRKLLLINSKDCVMMKVEWAGDCVFLTQKVEAKPDGPRNMAGLWKALYELDGLLGRALVLAWILKRIR